MFCFFHDQFIEEDKAAISINDRGFSLGDGVFDTQVTTEGHLLDDDLHFERLIHDASIMGIDSTKTLTELKTISTMLLAHNSITSGRWVIRTQLTRGIAARGVAPPTVAHPTLIMRAIPAPPINDEPVKAIVSKTTRRNEYSPLSRIKSTDYADNILALIEAKEHGADDAILLNTKGYVTCLTASNIFIVEQGSWTTPPETDGVLPGITRLKLIAQNSARQDHINMERLLGADEIWQANSVIGLRQVNLL